jgi:hypothetical protein
MRRALGHSRPKPPPDRGAWPPIRWRALAHWGSLGLRSRCAAGPCYGLDADARGTAPISQTGAVVVLGCIDREEDDKPGQWYRAI